jgi:hypothetical protein
MKTKNLIGKLNPKNIEILYGGAANKMLQFYIILMCRTHFEMLEAMANNGIGISNKSIFIFNCNGIFDNVLQHIGKLYED